MAVRRFRKRGMSEVDDAERATLDALSALLVDAIQYLSEDKRRAALGHELACVIVMAVPNGQENGFHIRIGANVGPDAVTHVLDFVKAQIAADGAAGEQTH